MSAKFVSLVEYMKTEGMEKKILKFAGGTIIDLNPIQRTITIDSITQELHIHFENDNALIRLIKGSSINRKVLPLVELPDFFEENKLSAFLDNIIEGVPFLQKVLAK